MVMVYCLNQDLRDFRIFRIRDFGLTLPALYAILSI